MIDQIHPPSYWLGILRQTADTLDWSERCKLPKAAARWMALHPEDESAKVLFELLAADPKWEVRRAVAEAMGTVPEALYSPISKLLSADANYDVSEEARRVIQRRDATEPRSRGPRYKGELQRLREIEQRYDPEAARMAAILADRRADECLRAVTHDLKVILARLHTGVSTLRRRLSENADAQRGFRTIEHGVADVESLSTSIGAFSRPSELKLAVESVGNLVEEAVESAKSSLQNQEQDIASVKLNIYCPAPIRAPLSRTHFLMAMTNLVKNAIESHGQAGSYLPGTVAISILAETDHVRITIADDGAGIPQRDLVHIREFAPGRTSKVTGTGFGLPIAKRYIEAQHGTLNLESEHGVGTTVIVQMPLEGRE